MSEQLAARSAEAQPLSPTSANASSVGFSRTTTFALAASIVVGQLVWFAFLLYGVLRLVGVLS